MRILAAVGVGVVLVACGCGSGRDPHGGANPAPPRPVAPTKRADPPPPPPPAPGPPPNVHVTGTPAEGEVAIAVTNASDAPVQLGKALAVEVAHGRRWTAVDGQGELTLRSDCQTPAPDCFSLVQGATLEPPAWLGTSGDAQCLCERCVAVPAGRYRFVIHTCDGARIEGTPFELTR